MARTRAVRVTRPARLGLIALVVIIVAALGIYLAVRFVRGTGGYTIGVRFPQAAGISPGAQVFLNGVLVGGVSKVRILPDTTVDFIINVFRDTPIPKNAKFSVRSSFAGASTVLISVPPGSASTAGIWPKRVLPVERQPVGTPPLTLETFMGQSRTLTDRSSRMLAMARPYGQPLLHHLRGAQQNAGATARELRATAPALLNTVQSTIGRAKANVTHAQTALRQRDQPKLAAIAQAFTRSASDMQRATDALASIRRDPQLRQNARDASAQLRALSETMSRLSSDMQTISGNPQTKAQLRDASARLHALLSRIRPKP